MRLIMEQKKLLWVLIAVSGFLILVFGFAMILYSSAWGSGPSLQPASTRSPAYTAPSDTLAGDKNLSTAPSSGSDSGPGQAPNQAGNPSPVQVTIVNGENASANFATLDVSGLTGDSGALLAVSPPAGEKTAAPSGTDVQPAVPAPSQAVKDSPAAAVSGTAKAVPETGAKSPAPAAKTPSKTAVKATPAKTAPVTVTEYWIQAGSFTAKANAEKARDSLKARYLNTEIFTKDSAGKTAYRVRIGPYKNKGEADYWLGVVSEIPGFNESYVSEVKTKR